MRIFLKSPGYAQEVNLLPVRRGWGAESPKLPTYKKPSVELNILRHALLSRQ